MFYVLTTYNVISWSIPTCDIAHLSWLYSAIPQGDQAASTITWYPTQSNYPDTEPASHCPILITPCTWLGSDKYQFLGHWVDSTRVPTSEVGILWSPKTGDGHSTHSAIPPSLHASMTWRHQGAGVVRLEAVPSCSLCIEQLTRLTTSATGSKSQLPIIGKSAMSVDLVRRGCRLHFDLPWPAPHHTTHLPALNGPCVHRYRFPANLHVFPALACIYFASVFVCDWCMHVIGVCLRGGWLLNHLVEAPKVETFERRLDQPEGDL